MKLKLFFLSLIFASNLNCNNVFIKRATGLAFFASALYFTLKKASTCNNKYKNSNHRYTSFFKNIDYVNTPH